MKTSSPRASPAKSPLTSSSALSLPEVTQTTVVRVAALEKSVEAFLRTPSLASSSLGKAYGQYGDGLPLAVSLLAVLMGLNLLEVKKILTFKAYS